MSILIAKYFHQKEERWLALKKKGDAEKAAAMTLEGANELALAATRRRRSEYQSRRSFSGRRMSERHTNERRDEMREQFGSRRARTENDVTNNGPTARKEQEKEERDNEQKQYHKRFNSFDPSVPAIPPRKTETLARLSSPPLSAGSRVSADLKRTASPEDMQSSGRDGPALHVVQSR